MTLSCILPVHNGERFLEEALASVLEQEHPDLEIIVVDDGSTDGSRRIVEVYRDRITLLIQDQMGCAAARNRALEVARGGFITFQDADDLWMPGKLRIQEERFAARPELEMCLGLVQNFWMEELAEEERDYQGQRFAQPVPGYSLPCLMARRKVFDRVGPFNEGLQVGSDNEWFLRARDAGVVVEVAQEVLLSRRLHAHNLTRSDLASRQQLLQNLKASLDRRRQSPDA